MSRVADRAGDRSVSLSMGRRAIVGLLVAACTLLMGVAGVVLVFMLGPATELIAGLALFAGPVVGVRVAHSVWRGHTFSVRSQLLWVWIAVLAALGIIRLVGLSLAEGDAISQVTAGLIGAAITAGAILGATFAAEG